MSISVHLLYSRTMNIAPVVSNQAYIAPKEGGTEISVGSQDMGAMEKSSA